MVEEYEASGDLGLRARGSDISAALASAVQGIVEALLSPDTIRDTESRVIEVQGRDTEEAVVNFLNEVLFLIFGSRWLPKRLETISLQADGQISARLVGEPIDSSRHHIEREIKAVTYHNLSISEDQGGVTIDFLCDL
jgi:SHS2 domain-containing protein